MRISFGSVILLGACVACSNREPRATLTPAAREPCDGRGIVVRVTPPEPGGAAATLSGSFAGPGMGAEAAWTCLVRGDRGRLLQGEFRAEVRAHATELQRIVVDRRSIVLRIAPGGELRVGYHPCANWELSAAWLDDGSTDEVRAVHTLRAEPCPDGFIDGGDIHEANDPRCGEVEGTCAFRRCVRAASVAFQGAQGASLSIDDGDPADEAPERLPSGGSTAWAPYGGFCPRFTEIVAGRERVSIAPGVGEQWILRLDDQGALFGTVRLPAEGGTTP